MIKDVIKTVVYQLCRWRNEHGQPLQVIPEAIINKSPSAELKEGQLDVDSLPPYDVLDPVVTAYVEEDWSYQDMIDFGFDELRLNRIWARCVSENGASAKVMEKVGMTREGLLRESLFIKDRLADWLYYSILRREWENGACGNER